MKHSIRIYDLVLISLLFLTAVGSAEEKEQPEQSNLGQQSSTEKSSVGLSVGTFDADSVRDAGIALRLKEAAQLYFYPKEFRSIVSLFGYPLEEIKRVCSNNVGDRNEKSEALAGIE